MIDRLQAETNQEREIPSYTNSLLENIGHQGLTKERFPIFQKDIKNILSQLMAQIQAISTQITISNIDNQDRINEIMEWAKQQDSILLQYCKFFATYPWEIPLYYTYLAHIAHAFKATAEWTELHIQLCSQEDDIHEKEKNLIEMKEKMAGTIKDISQHIKRISNIEFRDDSVYKSNMFSVTDSINKIIRRDDSFIKEKNLTIDNRLPENYTIDSYQEIFDMVIKNLLANATKFSPQWGKISIGIKSEYPTIVEFFVQNEWIPIPKEANIFDHGYTTPSAEGREWTWLWLTQCRIFLDVISGGISCANINPQGVIFSFTMPKKTI